MTTAPRASSFLINLSSAVSNQSASDFVTFFPTSIPLGTVTEGRIVNISVWNTQKNISDQFANRSFRFSNNGGVNWTVGILPSGTYNADALISAMNTIMDQSAIGSYPTNPANFRALSQCIDLGINEPTIGFKVFFYGLSVGGEVFAIDLANNGTSNLYRVFGANPVPYGPPYGQPADVDFLFPFIADISNGVTNYNVLCDICSSSTTAGAPGQTVFSYVPDQVPPGGVFTLIPPFPIPFQVAQKSISSIRVQILDNLNRNVNLQDGVQSFATNATSLAILLTTTT